MTSKSNHKNYKTPSRERSLPKGFVIDSLSGHSARGFSILEGTMKKNAYYRKLDLLEEQKLAETDRKLVAVWLGVMRKIRKGQR